MNQWAIVITAFFGFLSAILLGKIFIPFLTKLKFGQIILEIGPSWHKNKQGTPTMGGLIFIFSTIIAVVLGMFSIYYNKANTEFLNINNNKIFSVFIMSVGFAFIGFIDDYIKIVKKRNEGLTARQKLILQILASSFYFFMIYINGDNGTIFRIPFLGQYDFGFLYYPIGVIIIVAIVNSVNLTDGVDGLASSVTFFVSIFLMFISTYAGHFGETIMSTALASGCLGFLYYNFYPAKVFMGDTGSMFLGAFITGICFNLGIVFIVPILGIIFLCESLSVIIQVISFKITGKRVFKMSPIHHHFEMSGYSEIKIVLLFSFITFVAGLISLFIIYNGYI